jgi:hypothetical protein
MQRCTTVPKPPEPHKVRNAQHQHWNRSKKHTCSQWQRWSARPGQAFQHLNQPTSQHHLQPATEQQQRQGRRLLKGGSVTGATQHNCQRCRFTCLGTPENNQEHWHKCSAAPGRRHRARLTGLEAGRAASDAAREPKQPPNPANTAKTNDSCPGWNHDRRRAAGGRRQRSRSPRMSMAETGCSTFPQKTKSIRSQRQQRCRPA